MTKLSERIRSIIEKENISVRQFENKIGCSNGVIAKVISKNTDINSARLSSIIEAFPHYNAEWLLTGRGDMMRGTPREVSETSIKYNNTEGLSFGVEQNVFIKEILKENSKLNREIGKKLEKIEQLTQQLEHYKMMVSKLKGNQTS